MNDFRSDLRSKLNTLFDARTTDYSAALDACIAVDAQFDMAWPLPQSIGHKAVTKTFLGELRNALTGLHRRDLLFFGGSNIRQTGGEWIASLTHYVGNFDKPLWGVAPSHSLVFLRAGEFFRIEESRITEAKIIFDLPDLMRQCGRMPLPSLGTELSFPAPATQDGLCPPRPGGKESLEIVQGMLGDLHIYDPQTGGSRGQTGADGYWHENMMWYGPAGIGSNFQWSGFVKDHRTPFLQAFPDRKGAYLGVPATGKALTLRVMDFYRCDGRQICENWVCLDYGDLFAQMGINLLKH